MNINFMLIIACGGRGHVVAWTCKDWYVSMLEGYYMYANGEYEDWTS